MLEGYRRGEVEMSIPSPTRALRASFVMGVSETDGLQTHTDQIKELQTTEAQRSHPQSLMTGAIPDTPELFDDILNRLDDHPSARTLAHDTNGGHTGPEEDQYEKKKAKSIRTHYRYAHKFAGEIEENWSEKLENFVHNAHRSKRKTSERHLFMVYALKDGALKFFRNNCTAKIINWGEIVQIMNVEFNLPVRQEELFNKLTSVSLSDFMGDGKTEATAMRELILKINRLARMARPEDRYEQQKRLLLENAVSETLWGM